MTLDQWLKNRWLRKHDTSPTEVNDLFNKILTNKKQYELEQLTPDWKFAIIYNSILTVARIALYVSGYSIPTEAGHHEKTIDSLRFTLEIDTDTRTVIQAYRKQRNIVEYDAAGTINERDIEQAKLILSDLEQKVQDWLKKKHPQYLE